MAERSSRREWLIEAREKKGLTINQAVAAVKISPTLLHWLETSDTTIIHPGIADRIRKMYRLSVEQRNDLVAVQYEIAEKPKKQKRASYDLVGGEKA